MATADFRDRSGVDHTYGLRIWDDAQPTPTGTPTATSTSTATPTPLPATCHVVQNCDFEDDTTSWISSSDRDSVIGTWGVSHSGPQSERLGSETPSQTLFQLLEIPTYGLRVSYWLMHTQGDSALYNYLDVGVIDSSDGSTPVERATQAGYPGSYVGENAVGGPGVGSYDPVPLWMDSQGHRANILRPSYREFGAGMALNPSQGDAYGTLVFGSSANVPVFINLDEPIATSPHITVTLTIIANVNQTGWEYQISASPSFAGSMWQPYPMRSAVIQDEMLGPITYTMPLTVSMVMPAGEGQRSVFVRYRKPGWQTIHSRDTIWLTAPVVTGTSVPALPPFPNDYQGAEGSGAATFDYPLAAPGGILPPALTLRSSSLAADQSQARQGGPLGVGASLGEHAVLRRPDNTPADTSDDSFVLLWDGQALVAGLRRPGQRRRWALLPQPRTGRPGADHHPPPGCAARR